MSTFFELIKNAEASAKEIKPVIKYKADNEHVKLAKTEVVDLARVYSDMSIDGLYAEYIPDSCYGTVSIYKDFNPCILVSRICDDTPAERIFKSFCEYSTRIHDFTDFESAIKNIIANTGYIKNDVLYLLEIRGSEFLSAARESKAEYIRISEKREAEELKAKRDAEARERAEAKRKFEKFITECEYKFVKRDNFLNKEIETPDGKITTVVLYLMRRYNITVPMKTAGWINKALCCIVFGADGITYKYYSVSKDSTVFLDLLRELEREILKVYKAA